MPKPSAVEVEAGGRAVRVSSPDRVIYEATDRTPAVTKLMVAEYFARVEDGPDARPARPAHRAGTLAERRPPRHQARAPADPARRPTRSTRSGCPKGAPDYLQSVDVTFPSGRTAAEICPTEIAVPRLVRADGHAHVPPLAGPPRRTSTAPTSCASTSTRSPATSFRDAARIAGVAKELLDELGLVGFPKTSGNRGVHIYVRIRPEWEFVDVRHAAIGFGRALERRDDGVTTKWWKEERGERVFVDFNQNCRDRTIASAYSLRPIPGAPVSTPLTWAELAETTDPTAFTLFTVPDRLADGDPWAAIDDVANSLEPLLRLYEESGERRDALSRPTTRRCRASRRGCSRARRSRPTGPRTAAAGNPECARTVGRTERGDPPRWNP